MGRDFVYEFNLPPMITDADELKWEMRAQVSRLIKQVKRSELIDEAISLSIIFFTLEEREAFVSPFKLVHGMF